MRRGRKKPVALPKQSLKKHRLVLSPPEYLALLRKVFDRDNWKCRCCSRRNNIHGHHLKFRSHGGDDAEWNMCTLCNTCHEALHDGFLIITQGNDVGTMDSLDGNKDLVFTPIRGWKKPSKRAA